MGKSPSNQDSDIIQKLDQVLKNLENAIKPKKSDQAAKTGNKKWYKRFPFVQGFGFLILFASWSLQNIYENSWQDKKNDFNFRFSALVQAQTSVFSQEIAAKQFLALNFLAKDTNSIIKANTLRYLSLYCQDYIVLKI